MKIRIDDVNQIINGYWQEGLQKRKTQHWIWANSFINFAPLPEFEPAIGRINRKVGFLNNYIKQ
tara:strand:- start:6 stop:197 length:192 start_codon:yes stop_codon:yes gene_type:complete